MPDQQGELIAVAFVLGPHGVQGYVKAQPLSDSPGRLKRGLRVIVDPVRPGDEGRAHSEIVAVSDDGKRVLLKIAGWDDRTSAERLRGRYLKVRRSEVAPLPMGRYYVFDIIGLDVLTGSGALLGTVKDVLQTGANDVYVVKAAGGGKDILIPAVKAVVKQIDLERRRMVVDPLEGMV